MNYNPIPNGSIKKSLLSENIRPNRCEFFGHHTIRKGIPWVMSSVLCALTYTLETQLRHKIDLDDLIPNWLIVLIACFAALLSRELIDYLYKKLNCHDQEEIMKRNYIELT